MKRYCERIRIKAPPEHVWRVLADVANWPAWDPATEGAEGVVEKNRTLKLESSLTPGRMLPVTVTAVDEPFLLEWMGEDAQRRTHRITPASGGKGEGVSEVEISEEVLSAPPKAMCAAPFDLNKVLAEFLKALKERVEDARS